MKRRKSGHFEVVPMFPSLTKRGGGLKLGAVGRAPLR